MVLIATLVVVLCGLCIFTWWVYNLKKPSPGSCDIVKSMDPTIKWSIDCDYIVETTYDSSITAPTEPLYLTAFTSSPSLGPPLGAKVYYAYRYVNGKTGEYSKLSPWTKSPIYAGAASNVLPCKGGVCPPDFKSANKDSCNSNLPQLMLDISAYGITSGYYLNVHRYTTELSSTTPPTADTTGTLIGYMVPSTSGGFMYNDISKSPCTEVTCSTPAGC